MTEETQITEEPQLTTEPENGEQATEAFEDTQRGGPAFNAIRDQLVEERQRRIDLEEKLKKDAEAAELKSLEEQDKWKEIAEKHKAEFEKKEAEMLELKLTTAAIKAGAQDDVIIDGICRRYSGPTDGIEAYIEQFKKDKPHLFTQQMPAAENPAQGARSAGGNTAEQDWAVKRQKLRDPLLPDTERRKINSELLAYIGENQGKTPWQDD